jgi:hypothetical protein
MAKSNNSLILNNDEGFNTVNTPVRKETGKMMFAKDRDSSGKECVRAWYADSPEIIAIAKTESLVRLQLIQQHKNIDKLFKKLEK